MKILYKILKITGIVIISMVVFMLLTVVVAKVFEDELATFTVEKLESQINAPMSVGKVSLVPLFSFPRLSAEINQLYIGNPKSEKSDTLFFVNSLKVGLDTWDLIHGIYTIDEMEISGLDFDYEVDSAGKSNIDFIINAFTDTSTVVKSESVSSPLDLSAEELKLENIHIRYYDSLNQIGSQVTISEIILKAKTKNNIYQGKTNGSFILSHCYFEDTKINEMESCKVTFNLSYNDKEAIIKELAIMSEGFNLGLEGNLALADTIKLNAMLTAKDLDFDILKKYIPNQYISLIGDDKLAQIDNISVDIDMKQIDNYIQIQKLAFNSEGIVLDMKGNFTTNDTMEVDVSIEALNMDLNTLKKYVPKQYFKEFGVVDVDGNLGFSATIQGTFADSTLLPQVDGQLDFKKIMLKTVDYPEINEANLSAQISTGKKSDLSEANIDIYNFDMVSGKSTFGLKGNIAGTENTQYNLRSSLDITLLDFKKLIPDSLAQNLQGNIVGTVKTSGILPKVYNDDFTDYVLDNTFIALNFHDIEALLMDSIQLEYFSANIDYAPQGLRTKEIGIDSLVLKSSTLDLDLKNTSLSANVSGHISNPKAVSTKLKSLIINQGKNQLVANGTIANFETPQFDLNTNILLALDELMPFLPDSLITDMSGNIVAKIHSNGRINPDSLEAQLFPLLFEKSRINLTFNNVNLAFPDSIMDVDSLSVCLDLDNDVLTVDDFSAIYNGLALKMDSTVVRNIYKTVILNQEEQLYVNTHMHFGDFLFDDFKHLMDLNTTEAAATETNTTSDARNWTFLVHGSATINSVIVDSLPLEDFNVYRLHVNDLSSLFKLTDSSYIMDQFKFKVFEGEMNNSINYKVRNDGTQSVSTHHIIQNMNIRTMLKDMDNFGMDSVITYENISGLFSTDLNTFVAIDDSILMDRMMVSGDVILEKGGVYNYAPATEVSKFSSIKELDNIQFKTLRSSIFMFKNKLYVPRTNIVSNALDIAAFGMQSLDGNSQYHLELHLSNILFGKSNRRNEKQDQSGEEIDQESLKKSSQKIRYTTTNGKSKVGRDTKDDRNDMINKIRVQQKMLDFIFFPKNIHYDTEPE